MKITKITCNMMFSLILLTSCDISDKEIEQKAQSYTKSQYGFSIKLNEVEIPGNYKDLLGPDVRIAHVQQVNEPYLQFQLALDVNNPVHMEKLAELARSIQEFNKINGNNKSSVEDITIQLPNADKELLQSIVVDYILTADDAKKALERKEHYMEALLLIK
ncbi:hypothetical protein ORL62_29770 [Bacillus cereus]|uniref:hypothetical protein n=1 Tax=Bacillus cereus TaxID=1396 RepID=UPI002ABF2840|nr:hypothetical protein [Bacillus cereus]MDZ4411977.1 hypothetical protein [Bacillus cereus]